jgi:hypothetical protein
MVTYDRDLMGSIKKTTTPPEGRGQTRNDPRPVTSEPAHAAYRNLLESADASVTQAIEDVGEQLAGHRDGGDVAASPFGDLRTGSSEPVGVAGTLSSLHRCRRTSVEPCLVIGPRRTTVSDSRCLGVSPAHKLRCAELAKRVRPDSFRA